jgi:hypothetical protein
MFLRPASSEHVFVGSAGRLWLCFRLALQPELGQHFHKLEERGGLHEFRQALGYNMERATKALRRFRLTRPAYKLIQTQLAKEVLYGARFLQGPASPTYEIICADILFHLDLFCVSMWKRLLDLDPSDPLDARLLGLRGVQRAVTDDGPSQLLVEYLDADPLGDRWDFLIFLANKERCPHCGSRVSTFAEAGDAPERLRRCFGCGLEYRPRLTATES